MMLPRKEDYLELARALSLKPPKERVELMRSLCKKDLYFLCLIILDQKFYYHDFAFSLCKKVQEDPNRLWLVARGHLKSLTITAAHNIQILLNDPEKAIAIVSYNMKTAKSFVRQIKIILENNIILKELFPEIIYIRPDLESPKWSELEGLVVKRKTMRKEPSIMGFGLVDSQATGYHFDVLSYDDVVTQDSITSPDMILKTTDAWRLSDNIGMPTTQKKYCGTRYHYFDTYSEIAKTTPTITIPATINGKIDGEPIFLSKEQLGIKLREQGRYMFSAQMLLRPVAKEDQKFRIENFRYYKQLPETLNYYITVDPANTKKKQSDFTAIMVLGFSLDRKVYLINAVHDKLSLSERYSVLRALNTRYRPLAIGYEQYGLQADIDYYRLENAKDNYYMPLAPIGGQLSKDDRILRLTSLFEREDMLFPEGLPYYSRFLNREIDIINNLLMELLAFPFGEHDDLSDCLSRCFDLFLNKPALPQKQTTEADTHTAGYRFEQMLKRKRSI